MPDRQLYTLELPQSVQNSASTDVRRQLTATGVVTDGPAQADAIATDPDERQLTGKFVGETYGPIRAAEFEELFGSSAIEAVPFVVVGTTDPRDGYYTLGSQATVEPGHPADDGSVDGTPAIYRFRNARLTKIGSERDHWRSVAVGATQYLANYDFGSDETAAVGIPAAASKVRWYNPETRARTDATVSTTRTGEFGDIDVYDADGAPYSEPVLIFEVEYADDARADLLVWDTRGEASRDDADGRPHWQKVFAPAHDYNGLPVVSNKLIRLIFDEANNSLTAERWDDGTSSWTSQSLGTSDWELFDVDIYRIGVERVEAQVEFRDTTQSPTAYHSLDMRLWRGGADPQWARTTTDREGNTAPPSGLVTLLDPVATDNKIAALGTAGVTERKEVRK